MATNTANTNTISLQMLVTILSHQSQIKLHRKRRQIFPVIPGCFKRAAVCLYLRLTPPIWCPRVFEIEALPQKRGAHGVPDTQYPTRCRLSLKKKSTIGLDTKIWAVFVLISLVTQGAFESTRERDFEAEERRTAVLQAWYSIWRQGPGGCGLGGAWPWRGHSQDSSSGDNTLACICF